MRLIRGNPSRVELVKICHVETVEDARALGRILQLELVRTLDQASVNCRDRVDAVRPQSANQSEMHSVFIDIKLDPAHELA